MISPEDVYKEVCERTEQLIEGLVDKSLETLLKPDSTELASIVESVADSVKIRNIIRRHLERSAASIIEDRLRRGLDATAVDRAFDAVWTDQFQRALADRVRHKAYKVIDEVIAERLKRLQS